MEVDGLRDASKLGCSSANQRLILRTNCVRTCLLCTPPQINLAPSLIIWKRTSFPSSPIVITFLRSTISVNYSTETRTPSHSLLSSSTADEISSPSTTMRHCRLVLTVAILSMAMAVGTDWGLHVKEMHIGIAICFRPLLLPPRTCGEKQCACQG